MNVAPILNLSNRCKMNALILNVNNGCKMNASIPKRNVMMKNNLGKRTIKKCMLKMVIWIIFTTQNSFIITYEIAHHIVNKKAESTKIEYSALH